MKKVLVIEDEIPYSKLLRDELSLRGYILFWAFDGIEGLTLALEKHPDLILLDLRLPRMDGMTMLKELRKSEWGRKAKVMILTNLDPDESILKDTLETNPIFYIEKSDVTLNELLKKIGEVLM